MSTHLDLDDSFIEDAFDKEFISDWDYHFLTNLINYSDLSEKQDTKLRAILKKIQRGQKRNGTPTAPVQAEPAERFCKHCGHELN